jgi:hypothetical protein
MVSTVVLHLVHRNARQPALRTAHGIAATLGIKPSAKLASPDSKKLHDNLLIAVIHSGLIRAPTDARNETFPQTETNRGRNIGFDLTPQHVEFLAGLLEMDDRIDSCSTDALLLPGIAATSRKWTPPGGDAILGPTGSHGLFGASQRRIEGGIHARTLVAGTESIFVRTHQSDLGVTHRVAGIRHEALSNRTRWLPRLYSEGMLS